MTNEEAIEILNKINPFNDNSKMQEYFESVEIAINSIQENTKLKAEIEQLKSELEQSVKLPCKLGDVIYFRVKGMNQFAEYVDFIQTQKITRIDVQKDGILYCSATEKFIESDINKTIFLSREEAEQALKCEVSND